MQCPCGKDKPFKICCGRFIDHNKHAKTAEQLMRSRYSAFALGGYGQYLLDTWYPTMTAGLDANQLSAKQYEWVKLEVMNKTQKGDSATVEFKAYFQSEQDDLNILHENSLFKRVSGKWLYVGAIK